MLLEKTCRLIKKDVLMENDSFYRGRFSLVKSINRKDCVLKVNIINSKYAKTHQNINNKPNTTTQELHTSGRKHDTELAPPPEVLMNK